MTKLLCNCLLLLFLFLTASALCYGQTFGLEQDFPKRITLPDSIYEILLKDEDISNNLKEARDEGQSAKSTKKQYFQAARVNLNDDKLSDLVVKAQSYLTGANITRYWVFKRTLKGNILVLKVGAFGLSLLKNRSKGYRIIRTGSFSGQKAYTYYYRFDGNNYVYSWDKIEDL